ncbi:MAG TPA: prephenate dehydrogenase/arogenate dehydrogenase family protein [Candidatus Saccharimonadales bacterium]|jgi:prephenate dehydrogenase|nr:prephenate dehydrogenase/arogenate dehydrogenase family protein [Candidatus Saccharimonadales bacterium]
MRVGIAGCGLIGGSLALALRGGHDVIAFDPAGTGDIARAARLEDLLAADVVIVATPLPQVVPTLRALAGHANGAVLMDVGSVKRAVAAFADTAPATARIVGGHPMAGGTEPGFAAARADLFRDRPFLLVPTARSDERAMGLAGDVARAAGAVPTVVSAQEHDRMVAVLSGLPLAMARALARVGADVADLAGPGFRDATRLAQTSPALADAILNGNATEVRAALAKLREALDEVERELG